MIRGEEANVVIEGGEASSCCLFQCFYCFSLCITFLLCLNTLFLNSVFIFSICDYLNAL